MGESKIRKLAALSAGLKRAREPRALDTFGGRLHVNLTIQQRHGMWARPLRW